MNFHSVTKLVYDVTKIVCHGVTNVFDVTNISQECLYIWQLSIIYIKTVNIFLPRRERRRSFANCNSVLQHKLQVKGHNGNMIETS